ncbi:kelch-like protein 25 [Oculina patagonica]
MAVSDNCQGPSQEMFNVAFVPKDTLDQPCDITLVVEDGKEFQAHRQVLSEASPFFEKLLNSDMKESKEGVVRLEMFSECIMENTLEFIYTGNVEILTEDDTPDLIVMADYLCLQNLKTLACGVLLEGLNVFNCFSIYYFSERYQCEELFSKTQKFIFANFSAAYEANRKDVLNMSSREIEMFISSDEINVNAEEDVFNIILSWIDHDRTKRKKYFAELFRHVRLVYISRDFLCSDVVTNILVKDSEGCLDLVEDAMKLIKSNDLSILTVRPRKSLEACFTVIVTNNDGIYNSRSRIMCYFPREDKWCHLDYSSPKSSTYRRVYTPFHSSEFVSCRSKLYRLRQTIDMESMHSGSMCLFERQLVMYNPFTKNWKILPGTGNRTNRYLDQIFVTKEDEMYALEFEGCMCRELYWRTTFSGSGIRNEIDFCGKEKHVSFITKYKPESNAWEDMTSFENLGRFHTCIVAKDDFIYFIGGVEYGKNNTRNVLTDVDRFDLRKDQWNKVSSIHEGCRYLWGAAVNGKIFVAGTSEWHRGWGAFLFSDDSSALRPWHTNQCQVYDETTDEWQVIASLNGRVENLLAVDDKLYAVCSTDLDCIHTCTKVDCYGPVKDKWSLTTEIDIRGGMHFEFPDERSTHTCSMRIYKGFLADMFADRQPKSFIPDSLPEPSNTTRFSSPCSSGKCKCLIM